MDIEDVTGNLMDYKVSRSEFPEDLYQPLYDTVSVQKGDVRIEFFNISRGSRDVITGKMKTHIHTNMDCANVCPTKLYTLLDMFLKVKPRNQEHLTWLCMHGMYNLTIVDKRILNVSLMEWGRWTGQYDDRIQYGYNMPAITIQPYENFCIGIDLDEPWPYENIGVFLSLQAVMRRPT